MVFAVGLLALGAWFWLGTSGFVVAINADRNVLLVTIDTLRADALGSYGGRATTPTLDGLAARGARFDFAHAHAVVTLPSHASILTGRYPYEHGIRDNTGYRLPPDSATAATRLKGAGFATGAFIGGFPLDRRFGLGVGFDEYDDHLAPGLLSDEADERERRADAVVAKALAWIGGRSGKWFSWVHVYDPHLTYAAPEEWARRFPSDPYLGEVLWTDAALAPLFDALSRQPRPTLVIVTSDHGEGLGDHGEITHGTFAYETTLRVPLIVAELGPRAAANAAPAPAVTTPARHVDLLPTILESAGLPADPGLSGRSLVDVIGGRTGDDRPSYFEAMTATLARGWAPLRGVIVNREKYIDLPIRERYDLATDPAERNNLIAADPARAQVLHNTLRGFDVSPPGRPKAESAETLERLRSLGYIGAESVAARETYTEDDDPKRLIEIDRLLGEAGVLQQRGRLAEAIALYERVIARRRDTENAYRKLALVYWRMGRPNDAIATLERALANGVTQSDVRIKLGQYLAQSGRAAKAVELLSATAADDPDTLVALGNAYQMAGKPALAVRTFQRLITLDPASGLGHQNLGIMALQAGDAATAETSLRRALALDSRLPEAHTALGVLLAQTGRPSEAIDAWKRAVDVDPAAFDALYNLTINLARAGRRDEARQYGERYVATAPPPLKKDVEVIRDVLRQLR